VCLIQYRGTLHLLLLHHATEMNNKVRKRERERNSTGWLGGRLLQLKKQKQMHTWCWLFGSGNPPVYFLCQGLRGDAVHFVCSPNESH
jgi:hypothetical protein